MGILTLRDGTHIAFTCPENQKRSLTMFTKFQTRLFNSLIKQLTVLLSCAGDEVILNRLTSVVKRFKTLQNRTKKTK